MLTHDIHLHPAGTPSLGSVLDVGLKCVHSCAFCYYSFFDGSQSQFNALRSAPMRNRENSLAIVHGIADHGLNHLDITGGEPALYPVLEEVVQTARNRNLPTRLITLGQLLLRKSPQGRLLDRLIDSDITDFLLSLHAAKADTLASLTGAKLEVTLNAMQEFDAMGIQFGCNTVITQQNMKQLPDIAKLSVDHGVYVHNFIFFNTYHAWREQSQAASLQAQYSEVRPFLQRAVETLTAEGRVVNIRYVPLCAFPGLERHMVGALGTVFDPYEWRNRCMCYDKEPSYCAEPLPVPDGGVPPRFMTSQLDRQYAGTHITGMRGNEFKYFVDACENCMARSACDGIDPAYLASFGDKEFSTLAAETDGPLLRARLDYSPAFLLKTAQRADILNAIRNQGKGLSPSPS